MFLLLTRTSYLTNNYVDLIVTSLQYVKESQGGPWNVSHAWLVKLDAYVTLCVFPRVRDELLMLNFFRISGKSQPEVIQLFEDDIIGRKTRLVSMTK